ncbi:hypothetical protein [Caproiciproducens sp.]|uniref:hypothetical protein n=1 Tax=Caproiciproducens sp. TaxID=1954376 RepID=UPI0028A1FEDB|nr:hypothetical protein [Caproiciproducens sp.]
MDELKACPVETEELIKELRRYGLSNGGSLGRHMGIMDIAADRLEELNRRAAPENKPQTHCVECTNYRPYGDKGRGKCLYYDERFDVGDNHFCGYAVPKARKPEQEEKRWRD